MRIDNTKTGSQVSEQSHDKTSETERDVDLESVLGLDHGRRSFLKASAAAAAVGAGGVASTGSAVAQENGSARGTIELLGYGGMESPEEGGILTQGSVRNDGQYAVSGGYYGTIGSTLFDVSDPENPELVHNLPSSEDHRQNGIKFLEATDGIYLRTLEPNVGESDQITEGLQVVDYGWGDATAEDPAVIAEIELPGGVHKLDTHYDEPVAYTTGASDGHTYVVDFSDPENPEQIDEIGVDAGNHQPWVDEARDHLYCALIGGDNPGFEIFDISDAYNPESVSYVNYDDYPDYEDGEFGQAGFQSCHFISPDPERDILVVGDEVGGGMPGGKHVWDVGYDVGSWEEPEHVGFTHSPNAKVQTATEPFFWTGHVHDIVPGSATTNGSTILVDGGYHEGVWTCDITDPTDPQPAQQFLTGGGVEAQSEPNAGFLGPVHAPNVWSVEYNAENNFLWVSDMVQGGYTIRVDDDEFEFMDPVDAFAYTFGDGEVDMDVVKTALHYWGGGGEGQASHDYVPNSGRQEMTTGVLRDVVEAWRSS